MKRLAGMLAAAMAAATAISGGAAADLDEIRDRGVLKVAVAPLSPFVIVGDDGEMTGYEIDATAALAETLKVDVEYIEKPFCELADAIVEGEADMIASGYSNTELRRRIMDFSLPYHDTEYYLVVAAKKAKKVKKWQALNDDDVKIGYHLGGVSGSVAQNELAEADLRAFSSYTEIIEAMRDGKVHGAVMFSPYKEMISPDDPDRFVVPHSLPLMRTIEAYAIEQGAEKLRQKLNAWIIDRELSGEWDALEAKWFNPQMAEISNPPSEACASLTPMQ